MLSKELKDFNYYKRSLPLYVQSSYGFVDQFEMIWELLKKIDDSEDVIANSFGVMSLNVESIKKEIEGGKDLSDIINTDILNTVGELVGLSRYFSFVYKENKVEHVIDTETYGGLNDLQFLRYIQIKLLNLKYEGNINSLRKAYRETQIGKNKHNVPIYYIQSEGPATCDVILVKSGDTYKDFDELEEHMFKAGIYNIESLGIRFNYRVELANVGIWNKEDSDKGKWNLATWG